MLALAHIAAEFRRGDPRNVVADGASSARGLPAGDLDPFLVEALGLPAKKADEACGNLLLPGRQVLAIEDTVQKPARAELFNDAL